MTTITNAKSIQKKSKTHLVTQTGPASYTVTSGASGNEYHVRVFEHGAVCDCKWAQYRPACDQRSGCSHVVACYNHLATQAGRKVSAWNSRKEAKKQHKPIAAIGDGVTLTARLTSSILVNAGGEFYGVMEA